MSAGSSRGNGSDWGLISVGNAGIVEGATPAGAGGAFPGVVSGTVICPPSTPIKTTSSTTTMPPPTSAAVGGVSIRKLTRAWQRRVPLVWDLS